MLFKKACVRWLKFIIVFSVIADQCFAKETYDIGILSDFISPEVAPIFKGLGEEIKAVVGNDATIRLSGDDVLINQFDLARATQHYQSMLESDVDIILAFGPINNELISAQLRHRKPTILFGAVNSDVVGIDLSNTTSGVSNFTYIVAPISYKKDLRDFKNIFPFKRVGVVGAYGPWQSSATRASLKATFAELESDYKLIGYRSINQFEADIQDVDAVYLAEGIGISAADLKRMADIMIERKLPSFTSSQEYDVRQGWLATNQSDTNIERLFRRIALSVEAVVNGDDLADRPVYVELNDTITLNYNTAEKIDVPIRFSQIASTNLVGSFDDFVADESYTFKEAINRSLQDNLGLRVESINVDIAEADLSSAKTTYYPDLSVSASQRWVDPDLAALSGGQNPERTSTGALAVSQVLYSESGSAAISIRGSLFSAQQEDYRAAVLDTVLTTSQAVFNLLRLKNALQSQAENLEITKRNLKVAQQNFETGQAGKADIFRFQSEMAENMQALISAANSYRQAQHGLNAVLNRPIENRIEVFDLRANDAQLETKEFDFERLKETLDNPKEQRIFERFLIEQSLEISPELAALQYNLKSVERDIAQYGWRRYIPTVSANAQLNRVLDRGGMGLPDPNFTLDDDYSVGLVFSVPLFNQNLNNVNLKRAKKQKAQLLLQIENQRQAIENRVRDAVLDVSSNVSNIELSRVSEQAAKQSLDLIEASYASGAVTVTDLIDSQNNYLQAQLASSNALYGFYEAAVAMERAVGIYFFLDNPEISTEEFVQRYEEFRFKNQQ